MSKTHFIELINNIKKTKVAFISITVFVALGVAVFLGLSWIGGALEKSTENNNRAHNMHDLYIKCPTGLNEEDLARLLELDSIDNVEAIRTVYDFFSWNSNRYQAKVMSISTEIDTISVLDGKLPVKENEIAVDETFAKNNNVKVGDSITLENKAKSETEIVKKIMDFDAETDEVKDVFADDGESIQYLKTNEFTVTAIVVSPLYANGLSAKYGLAPTSGVTVDAGLYVDKSAFLEDSFCGITDIYVASDELSNLDQNSEEYTEASNALKEEVFEKVEEISAGNKEELDNKIDDVKNATEEQESEYRKEIADNEAQIKAGETKLEKAKKTIDDAKEKLADSAEVIENSEKLISDAEEELSEAKKKLDDAAKAIKDGEAEIEAKTKELEEGLKEYAESKALFDKEKAKYDQAKAKLDGAKSDLAQMRDIYSTYSDMISGLESGQLNASNIGAFIRDRNVLQKMETAKVLAAKHPETMKASDIAEIRTIIMQAAAGGGVSASQLSTLKSKQASVKSSMNALQTQINNGEKELAEALEKLNDGQAKLEAAKKALDEGEQKIKEGKETLESSKETYAEKEAEYESGKEELEEKKEELEEGKTLYEEKSEDLAEAEKEYEEKSKELTEARETLNKYKEELDNAIQKAQEQLNSYSENKNLTKAFISTRGAIGFLYNIDVLVTMSGKLRYSMAGLFALIGVLICYSALTRIIYSQIIQIGTKKALGFRRKEVVTYYLMYGGAATVLGCILGIILGILCEVLMFGKIKSLYSFDRYYYYFGIKDAVILALVELAVILLVSYIAAANVLKKRAIELLNNNAESLGKKHFYEKFRIWEKIPLFNKIVVNNFVTDTKRVIGTVIGITGCTALIVTGVNFKRSIDKSYNTQFNEYYSFDNIVYFDSNISDEASAKIKTVLDGYGIVNAEAKMSYAMIEEPDGRNSAVMIYVPNDVESFKKLVKLDIAESDGSIDPYSGIWGQYAYKNYYKNSDYSINVISLKNAKTQLKLSGFVKNYLTIGNMFASRDAYEEQFADDGTPNAYICRFGDVNVNEVNAKLNEIDGYVSTSNYISDAKYAFKAISLFADAIAYIYIVLSVILAILMIYNLFVQFIDEKKKELIVLRINGFKLKAVYRYVYLDAILLTVIGEILGVILGCSMGYVSVTNFESSISYFIKTPDWISCVVGIAGATLFTFVMCRIALRRIKHFKLTDIVK